MLDLTRRKSVPPDPKGSELWLVPEPAAGAAGTKAELHSPPCAPAD